MSKKKKIKDISFKPHELATVFNDILKTYGKDKWRVTYSVSIAVEPIPEQEIIKKEERE